MREQIGVIQVSILCGILFYKNFSTCEVLDNMNIYIVVENEI